MSARETTCQAPRMWPVDWSTTDPAGGRITLEPLGHSGDSVRAAVGGGVVHLTSEQCRALACWLNVAANSCGGAS
jgi:hypothetical protein